MGNTFNKKDNIIGPHSKVGLESHCHVCGKYFSKETSYYELNKHKENCLLKNKKINFNVIDKDINKPKKEVEEINKKNKNDDENNQIIKNKKPNSKKNLPQIQNKKESKQIKNNSIERNDKKLSSVIKHNSDFNLLFDLDDINLHFEEKINIRKKESLMDNRISNIGLKNLKEMPFEEKVRQFKKQINSLKIDWREAYCTITVDRENFLKQSIYQFTQIDPFKELHINFKGEVSHDAGGIIREWYTIIFKELQRSDISIYILI